MSWLEKAKKKAGSALGAVGDIAYDITGADNYMDAYRRAQQGNFMGALKSLGSGALETGFLVAPGFGAGSAAARIAAKNAATRFAGNTVLGVGSKTPVRRLAANVAASSALSDPVWNGVGNLFGGGQSQNNTQQPKTGILNQQLNALANAAKNYAPAATAPGHSSYFGTNAPKPQTQTGSAGPVNTSKRWSIGQTKKGRGDYDVSWDGKKWNIIESTRGKYSPAAGAVPGVQQPTEPSLTTPVSQPAVDPQLPSLSPEEAAMFGSERTAAESEFQSLMSALAAERAGQSIAAQESLRGIGRQEAGAAADYRSMAGETGLGLSPALAGVQRQELAQRAAAQRRGVGSSWAQTLAGLGQQQMSGELGRRRRLEDVRRQEAALRAGRSRQNIANLYGGLS